MLLSGNGLDSCDKKVFQNISVFLFIFLPDKNSSVYMFNTHSILFKINLGNKINCVCHFYQIYRIYYFTILHQTQNHYQNLK